MNKYDAIGSIVVYHNDMEQILKTVRSFLNTNLRVNLQVAHIICI